MSNVCDFVPNCADGSDEARCGNCTFQSDWCGWRDVSTGSFRFVRTSNSTYDGTSTVAMPTDFDTNRTTGYFLFVDFSQGTTSAMATVQSPVLRNSAPTCMLSFYYDNIASNRAGMVQVCQTSASF
jgi:hypothetical protein